MYKVSQLLAIAFLGSLLFVCVPALAIILHPGAEPNLTTWTDRPANAVVGKWSFNASFVVVSTKWALTTRHQNTSPATVDINGVTYNCIYNTAWIGGPNGNSDIRLIRLKNLDGSDPNFSAYAPPYTTTDEITKNIRIGGYGKTRAEILQNYGSTFQTRHTLYTYGYVWSTETSNTANTLHWCTNLVDGIGTANQVYTSDLIMAHFNDPGTTTPATQYEGMTAEFDSGGGWFIKSGSIWKVAGLTRGVEYTGIYPSDVEVFFRNPSQPQVPATDPNWTFAMDSVRVSSYAAWINAIIAADCNVPVVADFNGDCKVDFQDFAILANNWSRTDCSSVNSNCYGTDFQPDTTVDFLDLNTFVQNWLLNKSLAQ